jgi:hypothetical protein
MSSQSAAADLAPRSAARFVRDKSRAATQHYTTARPLLGSAAGFVADRWLACSSRTRKKLRKWPYQRQRGGHQPITARRPVLRPRIPGRVLIFLPSRSGPISAGS